MRKEICVLTQTVTRVPPVTALQWLEDRNDPQFQRTVSQLFAELRIWLELAYGDFLKPNKCGLNCLKNTLAVAE